MKMMKEKGHQIVFVTVKYDNVDDKSLNQFWEGIEIVYADKENNALAAHENFNNSHILWKTIESLANSGKFKFDYIIFPDCGAESFFTLLNKKIFGLFPDTKILMEIEGPMKDVALKNDDFIDGHYELTKLMEQFCFANTDFFTTPTAIMWEELKDCIDENIARYETIPNLVNSDFTEIMPRRENNKNIFFMGRLEYRKGPDLLFEAVSDMCSSGNYSGIRLQIAGRDQHWNSYGKTFREYWGEKLNEKQMQCIDYLEFLGHEELKEVLGGAWCAVFPSRWEPFGNVALESILAGVPVILPKHTGLQEIVGAEYEFLFEAGNKDDLEDKLKKMINLSEKERSELLVKLRQRGIDLLKISAEKFIEFLMKHQDSVSGKSERKIDAEQLYSVFYSLLQLGGDGIKLYNNTYKDYLNIDRLYQEKSRMYAELEEKFIIVHREHDLMKQYLILLRNREGN